MRRAAIAAARLASNYARSTLIVVNPCVLQSATVVSSFGHTTLLAQSGLGPTSAVWPGGRTFASTVDVAKEVDAVNDLFVAARDEIEYAKEEAETVYFDESVAAARKAVDDCLGRWEALLAALPEEERARVVRSMGLKIAQLQAEFDEVSKLHLED